MAQAAFVRGLALAFLIGAFGVGPLAAQENVKLYAVAGKYEDIKTDLTNGLSTRASPSTSPATSTRC
jgi:hypothetical protein